MTFKLVRACDVEEGMYCDAHTAIDGHQPVCRLPKGHQGMHKVCWRGKDVFFADDEAYGWRTEHKERDR